MQGKARSPASWLDALRAPLLAALAATWNFNMGINNEVLGFPLYHGTTSIFLDSINELGLGGENICEKYQISEMFTQIVEALKKQNMDSEWWICEGYICEKMIGGTVTNGGFNFRYGGVYLTPSLETAKMYAQSNKYGSELVSYFLRSYEELFEHNPALADHIFPSNHPLRDVIALDAAPVVLEISGITKDGLTTEQGEPIEAQLELMSKLPEALWQQFNFESRKLITSNNFKVLERNG